MHIWYCKKQCTLLKYFFIVISILFIMPISLLQDITKFFRIINFNLMKFILKGARANYYEQTNRIHRMRKYGYRYDRWND